MIDQDEVVYDTNESIVGQTPEGSNSPRDVAKFEVIVRYLLTKIRVA